MRIFFLYNYYLILIVDITLKIIVSCGEQQHLMFLVRRELLSWNESFSLESLPHDPTAFSYWVVSSLPMDDHMKITLLTVNSAVQRLRAELHIMRSVSTTW